MKWQKLIKEVKSSKNKTEHLLHVQGVVSGPGGTMYPPGYSKTAPPLVFVDIAPMADFKDEHHALSIANLTKGAVVTHAIAPLS